MNAQAATNDPHAAPPPPAAFIYVDTAIGGAHRRNHVMRLDAFAPPAGAIDCFTTVFRFTEDLAEHAARTPSASTKRPPSVRGYAGPALAPFLPVDFDC